VKAEVTASTFLPHIPMSKWVFSKQKNSLYQERGDIQLQTAVIEYWATYDITWTRAP